ncbi:MAG: hypothetical protein JHD16_17540 [Solirubrobacteraceae bacterium]|nr:hypothetical protein [Solirubrobacteraceae bacterium]
MSQPIDHTDDDDVTGTSEPAISLDDVNAVRGDGTAVDIVGAIADDERAVVDGVYGDDGPVDPAFQAVIEAGGGVSEGFEQSEAALIDHATDSEGSTREILFDAIDENLEVDDDIYGDADELGGDFDTGA